MATYFEAEYTMTQFSISCLSPVMQEILVNTQSLPPIYQECKNALNQCSHTLTSTQYHYAIEVIGGLAWLENNSQIICSIANENERNNYITKATSLVAETGLIQGNSKDEIKQSILNRTEEYREAYLFDRARQKLNDFFAKAFVGPPCFNGRLITLKEYIENEQKRISIYPFTRHMDYDKEAAELENIIYGWMEKNDTQEIPTLTVLKQSMGLHPLVQHIELPVIYSRAKEFVMLVLIN